MTVTADCPQCGEFGPSIGDGAGAHTCDACGCEYMFEIDITFSVTKDGEPDA